MSSANDFIIVNGVLKKYVGSGDDVIIPEGVTSIHPDAFRVQSSNAFNTNNYSIRSITIPEGVFRECAEV